MLEIYKGIKIEDEVIIVEKQNEDHQGYLVSVDNKKQLENALSWADTNVYDESLWEKFRTTHDEKYRTQYRASEKHVEGIVHKYKNGQFKFSLNESADGSSQGGKLSFWNCTITAPDGKSFLIGINSECLIQLLKHTTFVNGVCQSNIWLGRIKNNVGAFTEDMDEFKDSKKDQAMRDSKPITDYNTFGQIVKTKSDAFVYLGEWYKHFTIYCNCFDSYNAKYPKIFMVVHTQPKKMFCYTSVLTYDKKQCSEEAVNNDYLYPWDFIQKKKKAFLTDEIYKVNLKRIINNTVKDQNDDDLGSWDPGKCDPEHWLNRAAIRNGQKYICPDVFLRGNVFKKCFAQKPAPDSAELRDFIELFKLRGGTVFYDLDIPKEDLDSYGWRNLDEIM